MDRKGTRGSKPKNVPPKDLYALGSKSSGSSGVGRNTSSLTGSGQTSSESTQSQLSHEKSVHSSGYSKCSGTGVDRRESGTSVLIGKKAGAKSGFHGPSNVTRPGSQKISTNDITEGWENIAEVVETDDLLILLESAEEKDEIERIEAILCGAVKTLRSQRMKPDNILCLTLAYLAKAKPVLFHSSPLIIDAFCSLLKKGDYGMSFKAKTNPSASVLAANILLAIFQDEKCWPETFVKAYIEDSLGERLWVDHEDCKGFVDNIIASFKTKIPPKSSLYPDHGLTSRPDCPSPLSTSPGIESGDGDSEILLECRESLDVNIYNRYAHMTSEIEEMVIEAVLNQLNLRHQNVDAVARNFIRFLSTVTGIIEVRRAVAPKLEIWLQNHKHQRPAIELLMSMCLNCNTHSQIDQKVIGFIVHIRIKLKPLTNQYMSCLRELLSAHPDNIASVIKETTFNELSPTRNVSNMAILSVVFQYAPEHAAFILADIFLELLRNTEDFLRALRALLREIVRSLRHDMQYQKFCLGLMKEQKDALFKDSFEFKERMFHSIVDLIVFTTFVSISPQIREGANFMYRGENRDIELIKRYQETVSLIQQDALYWMHRVVPKTYSPSKEEYVKSLHKLVMMDQLEVYYHKDNWPTEGDRPLYFRLASEVPLKQESLHRLLIIGTMKEQYIKPQEALELADKLIKRATSITSDLEMLLVEDTKIIDLIFNLCPYIPPENSPLPVTYRPPKTAIANLYWKAWTMLLLITAHNPGVFGVLAWENYPTLRVIMEMCITNSFSFPPPTMSIGDKGEEMNNQELLIAARERQQILEFESHLAQKTITEQNSLLLSQLITMDPTGLARKPPPIIIEQLKALNSTNKVGHLLCRCRKPDFLVDIIQRQGAPQSMPWLAQLVESSDDAFSVLPVQCLCEFLLSETFVNPEGSIVTKHQQLLQHLRCLLLSPRQGEDVSVEILEYFLRRLSSQQPGSRTQAVRGLQLTVGPLNESMEAEPDKHEPYRWLLKNLPLLPGFPMIRSVACQALRAACQIETKPAAVSSYIRFLAVHTCEDSLPDMSALVQDMAQLIVERSTMISAILPSLNFSGSAKFPHAGATLNALFIIFINYMQGARLPSREIFASTENQDHVRIQWVTGEQAVMHILVVHAMVILLISGPSAAPDLFHQLLNIWFPENQEMPQAFLVDTAQEALLLPDWLKLKMIRSTVPQLVDAALKDLEPSQLVLFIQSFGIPVASMTKLLCALDLAVNTNEDAVAAAVIDKSHKNYMAQLVEVQHQRGARGGHAFAATLGERDDLDLPSEDRSLFKPVITPLKSYGSLPIELSTSEVQSFILQCFTCSSLHIDHKKQVKETMRTLQQHISNEISNQTMDKAYLNELLRSFSAIMHSPHSTNFIKGLHQHSTLSSPLFRLLLQMKERNECGHIFPMTVQIVSAILHLSHHSIESLLLPVLLSFANTSHSELSTICSSKIVSPLTSSDIYSEQVILERLNHCHISELERLIRDLVEIAMKEGSINLVVQAIVQLLINKSRDQGLAGSLEQRVALFLDWLQVFDPELNSIPNNLIRVLLFKGISRDSNEVKPLVSSGLNERDSSLSTLSRGYGQAYFLAAFTHQATWETLEGTIHDLLKDIDLELDPTAILDFIWAILHVPKLWQGRERRTPRHVRTRMPLNLTSSEQANLTRYIMTECQKYCNTKAMSSIIQKRIKLLFYCLPNTSCDLSNILRELNIVLKPSALEARDPNASSHLIYQMYLQRPCIIRHLSKQNVASMMKVQEGTSNQGQSAADVSLHTLLTMLTSPLPGKDFLRRMFELDAAVRKMASQHPLLVIRHLSLLAATLQGLTHLHWSVFQEKNYVELFSMVLGILELLQPYIFYPKYSSSFSKIIDAYIELFGEHGRSQQLGFLLLRICQLLMGWVGSRSTTASLYISKHVNLLSSLLRTHPDMLPLRSLAAIAASKGSDHPKGEKVSIDVNSVSQYPDESCLPLWHQQQASEIISQLELARTSEEQGELLKKVQDLSENSGGLILPPFFHFISEGMLSTEVENRKKSWNLLIQLLKRKPKMSSQISKAVLATLNSEEVSVAITGVKHLSRVILMLHEYSPDLLTAGFSVCLYTEPEVGTALSEALYLLTINTRA